MTEHTTIQITKAQANELQARKTHDDESYKSVLQRLIEEYNSTTQHEMTENRVREIANEQIAERVVPEAQR